MKTLIAKVRRFGKRSDQTEQMPNAARPANAEGELETVATEQQATAALPDRTTEQPSGGSPAETACITEPDETEQWHRHVTKYRAIAKMDIAGVPADLRQAGIPARGEQDYLTEMLEEGLIRQAGNFGSTPLYCPTKQGVRWTVLRFEEWNDPRDRVSREFARDHWWGITEIARIPDEMRQAYATIWSEQPARR